MLAAVENDVSWIGSDSAGLATDIEGPGRDFVVARLTYEGFGRTRRSLGYMGTFVGGPLYDARCTALMRTTAPDRESLRPTCS